MDMKRMSHNHGTEEGRGLACPERMEYGHPTGACIGDWARASVSTDAWDRDELTRLRLENGRLRDQLRRNDVHLRRRTAALVRLIARKENETPVCWCGGEVGAREPGDSQGLGCPEHILHDWCG